MEGWQQPSGPEDLIELAHLGLHLAFGGRVPDAHLLGCARDAMERTAFYRSAWASGRAFDDVRPDDRAVARLRSLLAAHEGAVICTFQIGPFLQLPFALAALDVPVMVLMDSELFEFGMPNCALVETGSVPTGHWPKDAATSGEPVHFITSDDQSAPWKMARWLKSGKVIFAYLDGNRGLESEYSEKNSVIVRFFGTDVWVRKGLAYLAGFTGVPLLFMVCRREADGRHVVRLSGPLRKRRDESAQHFCERAVRSAFRLLEAHIRRDMACWNEWSQLHRWVVRRPVAGTAHHQEPMSPEQVERESLAVEPQIARIRFGGHDVLVNHRTGAAIVSTRPIEDVLRLAGAGSTVAEVLEALSATYEEPMLLDIIHALAKDAFLQVNAS